MLMEAYDEHCDLCQMAIQGRRSKQRRWTEAMTGGDMCHHLIGLVYNKQKCKMIVIPL
jgi:hypothetical protein